MAGEAPQATGIRLIPPFIFLAALIVAFLLDRIFPLGFGLPGMIRWPLAAILIVVPFSIMPGVFAAFRRAGSHYDVRYVPNGLVTTGAFRYSRNPGYVAMIVVCLGIAVAGNDPWVLVCLVPAVLVLHVQVVRREEAILDRQFGEAYRAYRGRVRRWL